MTKQLAHLINDLSFRARLYREKESAKTSGDLTQRQALLLEILGMQEGLGISQINQYYPCVHLSTISATITALLKLGLVKKTKPVNNQRATQVYLTRKGRTALESLRLTPEQTAALISILEEGIKSFDNTLSLRMPKKKE
jgi:DNA-binding MarR family transcriptional regulator